MTTALDAAIFSQEYLNLTESFPDETVEIACSELAMLAMQTTESSQKEADNFIYSKTRGPRNAPKYTPVFGLNQLQRAAAVMLLLRKRWKTLATELEQVRSAVHGLATRAAELEAEADQLTRWDFLLMALFGKQYVVEKVRRKRVAANQAAIEL